MKISKTSFYMVTGISIVLWASTATAVNLKCTLKRHEESGRFEGIKLYDQFNLDTSVPGWTMTDSAYIFHEVRDSPGNDTVAASHYEESIRISRESGEFTDRVQLIDRPAGERAIVSQRTGSGTCEKVEIKQKF